MYIYIIDVHIMWIEQCVLNDTTLIIVVGRITYNAQVFRTWFPISKCYYDDRCRFRIIICYVLLCRLRVLRRNCSARNPAALRSFTCITSSNFFIDKKRSTTLITRVPYRFVTFITSLYYTCKCNVGDTIFIPRSLGSTLIGLSRILMKPWKLF